MPPTISTSWVGYYAYDVIDEAEIELPTVTFKMSWKFGWFGRFSGTVNDGPLGMPETGIIKGRFRNGKIDFTKYMPVESLFNTDGSTTRTNRPHPPIYYYGEYDESTKSLEGRWYIAPILDENGEERAGSGTWIAKPA